MLLIEVLEIRLVLDRISLHLVDHLKPPALADCASPGCSFLFRLLWFIILRSAHFLVVVVLIVPLLFSLFYRWLSLLMTLLVIRRLLVPPVLLLVVVLILILGRLLLDLLNWMLLRLFVFLRRRALFSLVHLEIELLFLLLWLIVGLCVPIFVVVVPLHLVVWICFVRALLPGRVSLVLLVLILVIIALVVLVAINAHFAVIVLEALGYLGVGVGLSNPHFLLHHVFLNASPLLIDHLQLSQVVLVALHLLVVLFAQQSQSLLLFSHFFTLRFDGLSQLFQIPLKLEHSLLHSWALLLHPFQNLSILRSLLLQEVYLALQRFHVSARHPCRNVRRDCSAVRWSSHGLLRGTKTWCLRRKGLKFLDLRCYWGVQWFYCWLTLLRKRFSFRWLLWLVISEKK